MSLSRRQLFQATGATAALSVTGQVAGASPALAAIPWARPDIGVSAYEFDLGQVRPASGRWLDNQSRTLSYLRFVDVDRLLYVFQANHRLSTGGAAANGGPGGRRGVGPAWGGGTWSADYTSFWCCQGTGIETNTKLMDSIYFHDGTTLFVNLFVSSTLDWSRRGITVTQTTSYPVGDTASLQVTGNVSGSWTMRIRIPSWPQGATVSVNGVQQNISVTPGSYADLTRSWTPGDTVTVRLTERVVMKAANDNPGVQAVTYGPVVLSGDYGDTSLSSAPTLTPSSIIRTSTTALAFTATASGGPVNLRPFYDAHGHNYVVYWNTGGQGGTGQATFRLVNAASGPALGNRDMSTADGGLALQWADTGTADHRWRLRYGPGATFRIQCANGGRVLGLAGTSQGAQVVRADDNGANTTLWRFL
ncbi:hypothetical protein E1295_13480 [Nonomuraea mesophila]|uniref:Uncharacterized protein n=1 Tax=Nonomuraea mesophila TaxID=2530382 RepID=A0A4R5FSJ0_9ACTN|nr:RICIN domain-containing protein [Nonomuraea mesophila]TDE55691.1 hypothetical protein E1295_13480 [Nonomuraea mesophila]